RCVGPAVFSQKAKEMPGEANRCREHARRCAEIARHTASPEVRDHFTSLEQSQGFRLFPGPPKCGRRAKESLAPQERIGGETHGQEQGGRHAAPQKTSRNEHTSDRVAARVGGGRATGAARKGEILDSRS